MDFRKLSSTNACATLTNENQTYTRKINFNRPISNRGQLLGMEFLYLKDSRESLHINKDTLRVHNTTSNKHANAHYNLQVPNGKLSSWFEINLNDLSSIYDKNYNNNLSHSKDISILSLLSFQPNLTKEAKLNNIKKKDQICKENGKLSHNLSAIIHRKKDQINNIKIPKRTSSFDSLYLKSILAKAQKLNNDCSGSGITSIFLLLLKSNEVMRMRKLSYKNLSKDINSKCKAKIELINQPPTIDHLNNRINQSSKIINPSDSKTAQLGTAALKPKNSYKRVVKSSKSCFSCF